MEQGILTGWHPLEMPYLARLFASDAKRADIIPSGCSTIRQSPLMNLNWSTRRKKEAAPAL